MDVQTFRKRFKSAEALKQVNWENYYKETMELFCPHREDFHNGVKGQRKGRTVYTSAPYIALDKASNNLQSGIVPPYRKWINLRPGRLIPPEAQEKATKSLQEIRDTLFDNIFASNFDIAMSEIFKDLLIGTACLMVTSTPENPIICSAVPLHQLYFRKGEKGTAETVFRKYKLPYGILKKTWYDFKTNTDIEDMIKADPEKEVDVVEGVIPKRIKFYNMRTEQEEERDGFGYYVTIKGVDGFVVERDMPVNPFIVIRWSLLSGEEWGRGPAIIALNDAKTLNQFIKLHMQSMELTVHPMYTVVDDGVININNIRIGPGSIIPVSANDGVMGATIQPLRSGGNFQAGQIETSRLETSINDQLYTEPLGNVNLPVKTATEISIRQQEISKRVGSAYSRIMYEGIIPFVNLCLYYLDKLNLININDFKVDGHNIAIDAISPLAQSQAQDEITNMIRWVEFAVGSFGPELAMTMLKPDEVMAFIGKKLDIPQEVLVTEEDKQKMISMLGQLKGAMPNEGQGQQTAI